ncbi:hypothetical protein [Citrobacter sp. Marseille-Q6884]
MVTTTAVAMVYSIGKQIRSSSPGNVSLPFSLPQSAAELHAVLQG